MIHPFYKIAGIDISEHQGVVDFSIVAQKASFIILRAGVGQTQSMQDSRFAAYKAECVNRNLPWGAYWFWVPEKDPELQAEIFKKTVKSNPPLGAWADVEANDFGIPQDKFAKNLVRFLRACDKAFTKPTGLYTAASFWNAWITEASYPKLALLKRKKWVAQYVLPEYIPTARNPWLPDGFPTWHLWQFSAQGNGRGAEFGVSSPDIDLNVFPGNAAEFKARFGVSPNSQAD